MDEDERVKRFYRSRGWVPDGTRTTIDLDRPREVVRMHKDLLAPYG